MDCIVCTEPFNRSNRKMIECHHCFFKACHECVGRFILDTDHPTCMNCHKRWDDVFLRSHMTKVFLEKSYKQHVMDVLMREIEPGLGQYQEIATTSNEKETFFMELSRVRKRLEGLEEEHKERVHVEVQVGGRIFQLYHRINHKKTPASRYGNMILHYVEGLVNPPPTEQDREQAVQEEIILTHKVRHHQFLMMCAILDKNVFYTDQLFYATSSSSTLPQENMETITTQLAEKKKQSYILYEQYLQDMDNNLSSFTKWSQEIRDLYKKYWEQYFSLSPTTPENLLQILKGKDHYSSQIKEKKKNLLHAMHEKADVWHRFHSNKQYVYNLDNRQLCPLRGTIIGHDVLLVLEKEEKLWKDLVDAHQEERERLVARSRDLHQKYKEADRKLRLLNRNKTVSGNYILSCPKEGCRGKLADNGQCGLCQQEYCMECRKENHTGHVCQQEDVDTVCILKKTTRPCPRCGVFITKSEGCDQMWCVQCHTTFSWKSGAISQGVVHNPHFFHHRQQATRTPGDIPCGGLPHEVEILMTISRLGGDQTIMYDLWDYCNQIAEEWMPHIYQKFHNVRPLQHRRHSIAYMRGKIDKKQLRSCLYRNYRDEIRYAHFYGLLETFVDNMAEYMRQFVQGKDTQCECRALVGILRQDIQQTNKIFQTSIRFYPPFPI